VIPSVTVQFSTCAPASFNPFRRLGWKNRWSKAIRMLGHTYFSHVDFVIENDACLGASYNPAGPVLAGNPRGVAIRPRDYQSFGIRRRMTLNTPTAKAILDYARSQIGRPFDSGALSPKVFLADPYLGAVEDKRDWREPTRWFCAELVICAFEHGGYWGPGVQCPILKNRVTPGDLYEIFMMDPNFVNRDTFFDPIEDLPMGPYES
jgi:hypothetical protein